MGNRRQKHPTMAGIAAEAGVSKNTVSLALRDSPRISLQTRRRVKAIADRVGYQQNATVSHLMAALRASQTGETTSTLGLVNANEAPDAFRSHRTIPAYVDGCRRRARQRGYGLDEFWLHDPELQGERLARVLRARNVGGLVIVGMMSRNVLPRHFQPVWENFACIVTGVRTRDPALSFSCVDHHALVLSAYKNAIGIGYSRPALVLDSVIDELVEGRFTSGFVIGQRTYSKAKDRTRPFYDVARARNEPEVFKSWLDRQRPDVIFTLYHETQGWLESLGCRIPRDVGLIQLEWREEHADWAGMEQHNDLAGEIAVDMLITRIHQNERGVPPFPQASLTGASWRSGKTVRRRP